jgi:hypothetical protein
MLPEQPEQIAREIIRYFRKQDGRPPSVAPERRRTLVMTSRPVASDPRRFEGRQIGVIVT